MKTFTATPEEFMTGQAILKARDLYKNKKPRLPRQKLSPPKKMPAQIGTISPEIFGRGDAYWTGRRRLGHRTKPSSVIKPMAEALVDALLKV